MNKFEETLKKYLDLFSDQETYFLNDKRNLDLFAAHPSNTAEDDVRTKVSAINDEEFRLHVSPDDMVKHILQLNMDDRLTKGDLTVVEDIAHLTNDPKLNLLHFASAYCNFHQPLLFPIYSEQHFYFFPKYIQAVNLEVNPDDLKHYPVFCKVLTDFIQRLGLQGKYNFLQVRKFGWLYFEKVLAESKE
jgi:hypothetical protein